MVQLQLVHSARRKAFGEARLEVIRPYVELLGLPKDKRFPRLFPDGTRVWTIKAAREWCVKCADRSPRTIWRWLAIFKAGGKRAFERPRSDKGRSRFFAQHRKAASLAAYVHQTFQPTVRSIHREIARNRKLLCLSAAELPSYETVRQWLRCESLGLLKLALEGQQDFRELVFSEIKAGLLIVRKDRSA